MQRNTKTKGIFIQVTEEENKIIKELKTKYAINISQFIRNSLVEHHDKLKKI